MGSLQLKVNQAILSRDVIDEKLKPIFDVPHKFEKTFSIYLKFHSSKVHIKSQSNGRILSESIYKKVVLEGKTAFQKSDEFVSPEEAQQEYFIAFQTR